MGIDDSTVTTPKTKKATAKKAHIQLKKCKVCKHTLCKGEQGVCLDCADLHPGQPDPPPTLSPHPIPLQQLDSSPQNMDTQDPSTSTKPPEMEELFDWIKSTIQSSMKQRSAHSKGKALMSIDMNSSDSDEVSDQDTDL